MRGTRRTIGEARWPETPAFKELSLLWSGCLVNRILGYIWTGYDRLADKVLSGIEWGTGDYESVERSVTQLLEAEIQDLMSGESVVRAQHGSFEDETRSQAPAMPRQYDIAFVMRAQPRLMWPFEAKIVRHVGDLDAYELGLGKMLRCEYGPFSPSAAMAAYLLTGEAEAVFVNLAARLGVPLMSYPPLDSRAHRVSKHVREVPRGKPYARELSCHHLVMPLQVKRAPRQAEPARSKSRRRSSTRR